MGAWEDPAARVDNLVLMSSRAEVEACDIAGAATALRKLLKPENAERLKGRLIFGIKGYDDDPRELFEIPEVRTWMQELDRAFPYWFYFMNIGPHSTLSFITFSLCRWKKVPGGKYVQPEDLQSFLVTHFAAMNQVAASLGEPQQETDARSREISWFFFPELDQRDPRRSKSC